MIIALDYDNTFDRDPDSWYEAMLRMKMGGHTIIGATMRYPSEASGMSKRYEALCTKIYFTSRQAKKSFLAERGQRVDVWIDDTPEWILGDALA